MAIDINNASLVHRVWADGGTEFLAQLQHAQHAHLLAEALADDDTQPRGVTFTVVDGYKGELKIYKQPIKQPHPGKVRLT